MALRLSAGVRNFTNQYGSLKQAFANGKMLIYTGAQPADANAAVTGTLLVTITDASGAHTNEVQATGTVTLNTGASGSVDTLTVNGIEIMGSSTPFNASLVQTAADICTKINNNPKNMLFIASNSGSAVITIKAKPGLGTLANGWVVASTVTTITKTDVNMASGVSAVNGLLFGSSLAGVLSKVSTQTWSGTAVATGTAGWFRLLGSVNDAGGVDSTETAIRMDGNIATSGANLNMTSTSIATSAPVVLTNGNITEPANA